MDTSSPGPRRVTVRELAGGSWLRLEEITYADRHGTRRTWEAAARRHHTGAVVMIARLRPSGDYLLVQQYRPPADRCALEFPAGLIDAGETPAQTALRELTEETGYVGVVRGLTRECLSSPGMSGESVFLALMDVDEHAPANRAPQTDWDESEHIEVCRVPEPGIPAFLRAREEAGVILDSKVVAYFLGAGLAW